MGTRYKVYATPRTSATTYGTEVEITDRVERTGLKAITRKIDTPDYDVGVYNYSDLDLDCDNSDGYFSGPNDSRSAFTYSLDLAKIRVVYSNDDGDTITFRGIVNDEASRIDVAKSKITLKVLSYDSVIRKSTVPVGRIVDGTSIRDAIYSLLNTDEVRKVLTVTYSNINPDQSGTVDDGSAMDDKPVPTVLNQLLFASNSVMLINSSGEVIVQSRAHDTVNPILYLYGNGDLKGRENIVNLTDYNSGFHRMFNQVKINDTLVQDADLVIEFGARQKALDISWLTDTTNITTLANRVLREWKVPKQEFKVTIATSLAKDYDLFDRVSVDFPLRIRPTGQFLPIIGITEIGDTTAPLPNVFGALKIDPTAGFKIIEISENPRDFTTTFKLRQIGVTLSDGLF